MPEDLNFLTLDVKRQQEIAQEALNEAKRLDSLINSEGIAPEVKPELKKAKESLLRVARDLAANATLTSTSAVTFSTSLSK